MRRAVVGAEIARGMGIPTLAAFSSILKPQRLLISRHARSRVGQRRHGSDWLVVGVAAGIVAGKDDVGSRGCVYRGVNCAALRLGRLPRWKRVNRAITACQR